LPRNPEKNRLFPLKILAVNEPAEANNQHFDMNQHPSTPGKILLHGEGIGSITDGRH
jgi:hypothetical protein